MGKQRGYTIHRTVDSGPPQGEEVW